MSDINNMSIEDLIAFADKGELPENDGEANSTVVEEPASEEFDFNALSPEDLLAMASGEDISGASAPAKENEEISLEDQEPQEANEDDLLAMLENTVAEDELYGTDNTIDMEVAKGIEKIKLRQLANHIQTMAPPKLFTSKKDEIYYFLSSMAGQSPEFRIDDADEKVTFIGKALKKLESYLITEVEFSLEEQETLLALFEEHSKATVDESQARSRVFKQFKTGWRQTLKLMERDIRNLRRFAKEPAKPIWILCKFYESLTRAYGLCRAQEDLKDYSTEMGVEMSRDEKRSIINTFEDILEVSKFYGLGDIDFVDRKGAYAKLDALDLANLLKKLHTRRKRG